MNQSTAGCPCGSGNDYAGCCGRLIDGGEAPTTAEQLMRSRYVAYVTGKGDYLSRSWHSATRPEEITAADLEGLAPGSLTVVAVKRGAPSDSRGIVEFIARFTRQDEPIELHEVARFEREEGIWRYRDGQIRPTATAAVPGRNEPCSCGSGRKYKKCCGRAA